MADGGAEEALQPERSAAQRARVRARLALRACNADGRRAAVVERRQRAAVELGAGMQTLHPSPPSPAPRSTTWAARCAIAGFGVLG